MYKSIQSNRNKDSFRRKNAKILLYIRQKESKDEAVKIGQLINTLGIKKMHLNKLVRRNILVYDTSSQEITISPDYRPIRVLTKMNLV